jgi:hypothetical protein
MKKKYISAIIAVILKSDGRLLFLWLSLFSYLPLLIVSFFNNPGSDDFDYSYETQVEPFFSLQIRRYYEWSGRYFSNGLLSFDPLVYNNYFMFKIVPILLLVFFILMLYFFVNSLNVEKSSRIKWALVGFVATIFLSTMPDVCEGFYWLPGAITNQLPISLLLLLFGALIIYYRSKNKVYFTLALVSTIAAIGCNEITVVVMLVLVLFLLFYSWFVLKKIPKSFLIFVFFTLLFAVIEILAPGNSARNTLIEEKHNFFYSFFKSFQHAINFSKEWFPIVIISFLFIVDNVYQYIEKVREKKYILNPLISFLLLVLLVFVGLFPACWSLNNFPPGRALNTIYFIFIIGAFYFLITLLHYCKEEYKIVINYSKNVKIILGSTLFLLFISKNNITGAYHDLLSGKAYKYDKEMKARFELTKKSTSKNCELPALLNFPSTIYSKKDMGLTTDSNNWKNLEYSRYFRKESTVIIPADTIITE